jgi:hypothetical protein
MSERAPYSRIYWSVMDDPKFENVYADDAAFALWVRLLMTADALWPAAAPLPRGVKPKPLARLVEAGIVDLVSSHRYRIHGLDAERERRKSAATTRGPNGDRTVPGREANGDLAKPRQDETSQAETPREDPAEVYWALTGRFPQDKPLSWIDDMTAKFGADATIRAMARAHREDRSAATLLGRVQDHLRSEARQLDGREREAEQARLAEKRSQPRREPQWRAEFRQAIEDQYRRLEDDAA